MITAFNCKKWYFQMYFLWPENIQNDNSFQLKNGNFRRTYSDQKIFRMIATFSCNVNLQLSAVMSNICFDLFFSVVLTFEEEGWNKLNIIRIHNLKIFLDGLRQRPFCGFVQSEEIHQVAKVHSRYDLSASSTFAHFIFYILCMPKCTFSVLSHFFCQEESCY